MFGWQRVGDLLWAAADARARGFLIGATAGRTTLMGEGLQHQDGHSLILSSVVPVCRVYDPAFAYEMGAVIEDGIQRMYGDGEDVYYYLTAYNENYVQPPKPPDVDQGILDGLYRWSTAPDGQETDAAILFSGTANLAARKAQMILAEEYGVGVELWSATSYKNLREEAMAAERWNLLNPTEDPRVPLVTELLAGIDGPKIAVTDFMRMVPDQVGRWVPGDYVILGTDGFGRSDTRVALRRFFETDATHVVYATLSALARQGRVSAEAITAAARTLDIDVDSAPPWTR
jgi:pyruvate dehydrogenase E1 component